MKSNSPDKIAGRKTARGSFGIHCGKHALSLRKKAVCLASSQIQRTKHKVTARRSRNQRMQRFAEGERRGVSPTWTASVEPLIFAPDIRRLN